MGRERTILDRSTEILFASDVVLGGLDGCVSEEELDLLQCHSSSGNSFGAQLPSVRK